MESFLGLIITLIWGIFFILGIYYFIIAIFNFITRIGKNTVEAYLQNSCGSGVNNLFIWDRTFISLYKYEITGKIYPFPVVSCFEPKITTTLYYCDSKPENAQEKRVLRNLIKSFIFFFIYLNISGQFNFFWNYVGSLLL